MNGIPPIPSWDGIHPLLVDFVIVLLMLAPLLLLVSLFTKHGERPWANAALLVLLLGTFAAWLAVGSGHAAATLIEKSRNLGGTVVEHERMGLLTRNLFTVLSVLFATLVLWPVAAKKELPRVATLTFKLVFLGFYLGSTLGLATAAYRGARLVHEYAVHAVVPGEAVAQTTPAAP